jgi:CNT family concentrative nucleoside transporter
LSESSRDAHKSFGNVITSPKTLALAERTQQLIFYLTRWWIAGLVLHRHGSLGWLKPTLLWLAISIRLLTLHVSTKYVTKPIAFVWVNAVNKPVEMIPQKFRLPLGAAGTIAVILVGTFVSDEFEDNTRANRAVSLFGLLVFIGAFYATSRNRSAIQWQTVIVGMLAQFILALFVLRTKAGVSKTPRIGITATNAP